MAEFNRVVWAAVAGGNVDELVTALASHPHLIDTPNPSDWSGGTPLSMAAKNGRAGMVEKLIEIGSKAIDTPDKHGCTPLYAAVAFGRVSVIETLIRLGSKAIDTPNKQDRTPVEIAALNNDVKCLNALRWLGADCSNIPTGKLYEKMVRLLHEPVDEDKALEMRHRVYFSQSLVSRLLFELDIFQQHHHSNRLNLD